jgi:uncharacterized membrane protein
MPSNKHELKTAIFEDGTHAVLRADPANPRLMEVIATFYSAAHAHDYVRFQKPASEEHREAMPIVKRAAKVNSKQASKVKPKQLPAASSKQTVEAKPKRAAKAKAKPAPEAKSENAAAELSGRQAAVLKALRSLMDKKNRVEVKAAELAKASSVPLGSLHSILVSLEKKQMIRTERQGSPKFSAIYEVLETARKSTRSLNGAVHGRAVQAQAAS